MPQTIQVGTILVRESPLMPELFGLEIERYSGNRNVVKRLDGFALDRKIHVAGWNIFFMGAEVKAMFFGAIGEKKIQNALQRILGKVRQQPFNALKVTGILTKRFLGVLNTVVSAHSRHIQQSCYLDERRVRWTSQIAAWNRSEVERVLRFRSAVS
jgi:hypothetical protein